MVKKRTNVDKGEEVEDDRGKLEVDIETSTHEREGDEKKTGNDSLPETKSEQLTMHNVSSNEIVQADKPFPEESRSVEDSLDTDKITAQEAGQLSSAEDNVTKTDIKSLDEKTSTSDKQEEGSPLKICEGPFRISTLLDNVPSDLTYTCCEAYENHIFLGTTTGDLLHYFELERGNYMLVSQTKLDAESNSKIDKILLLPKVEGALILCNNELVLFILPEFAPRPNTTRLKGINDVVICNFSRSSKAYRIYAFHTEGVRLLKISADSLVLAKTFNFKLIDKACAHEETLMVSKLNNYELINLKSSQVIPLFRISETDEDLEPIITSFNEDNEFLVCSGGGSYESGAIALVVNHHGDIIKGTIVLKNYPRNVIVEFPYIIVESAFQSIDIYSALPTEESQLLQSITSSGSGLKISKSDNIFTNTDNSKEYKEKLFNKLRLEPLTHSDNKFRIERERAFVEESYEEKTSLIVYNNLGIHLLVPTPMILRFTSCEESEIDNIEDQLKKLAKKDLTKFENIEAKYLMSLLLFLMTLHYDHIEDEVMKRWCDFSDKVNIRILFYMFGWKVYSEIWCFHGLVNMVERLKSLKLSNKCEDVIKMLLMMKSELKRKNKTGLLASDFDDIMKTIDITLFNLRLEKKEAITIDMFERESYDEIIKEINIHGDEFPGIELLIEIYKEKGEYLEPLNLLKEAEDYRSLVSFIEKNIKEFPEEYVKERLADDLILTLKQDDESPEECVIKNILKILSMAGINKNEFLDKIPAEEISLKVSFIEELGIQNSNDSKFLFNYYLAKLREIINQNNIWSILEDFIKEYKDDLAYDKTDITNFVHIKLKHNLKCESFSKYYEKCENLKSENEKDDEFINFTFEEISKIDKEYILSLLFFPNELINWISSEELLKIYLSFNDFKSVEKYTGKQNLVAVMKQYLDISSLNYSVELVTNLLQRNFELLDDLDMQLKVLETIPSIFPIQAISQLLLKVLIQYQERKEESNLRKCLLKNQISISDELSRNFESQE
ncbi:CORVET complex subunit VPS3 [Saccharomyces paradoxus]|uniref:CORVET complex subunit VPS3 n=1 Tax=Saccharomyces paradoxus TaxID=27291 RepID=A0A8B8UPL1_SACPA|nr:Vps3 [Saccharomyces paradoxus]QHS72672.1 Vps3 [Saccharomyces paradoxus]